MSWLQLVWKREIISPWSVRQKWFLIYGKASEVHHLEEMFTQRNIIYSYVCKLHVVILFLCAGRSDIMKHRSSRTDSHWWTANRPGSSRRLWAQQKPMNWTRRVRKSTKAASFFHLVVFILQLFLTKSKETNNSLCSVFIATRVV